MKVREFTQISIVSVLMVVFATSFSFPFYRYITDVWENNLSLHIIESIENKDYSMIHFIIRGCHKTAIADYLFTGSC